MMLLVLRDYCSKADSASLPVSGLVQLEVDPSIIVVVVLSRSTSIILLVRTRAGAAEATKMRRLGHYSSLQLKT